MNSDIEVRSLSLPKDLQVRIKRSKGGNPRVVGYAAVFNRLSEDLGGFKEQINPKAFDRALERCDVRALINHDANMLMGRTSAGTLRLEADGTGLKYDFEPPRSPMAEHYLASIDRQDMTGSSFSFTVDRPDGEEWDDDDEGRSIRTVNNVRDIFDVGPVSFPAYLDTTVASRSLQLRAARGPHFPIQRQRLRAMAVFSPFLKG